MALNIVYQPKQAQGFIEDCNGVPLHMMLIPSGTFTMGAPATEEGSTDSERPQHQVSVSQFFMGRYPITQAQWKAIALLEPSINQLNLRLNPESSSFKGKNRPVEEVSWREAIEFCARLSRHTGRSYRLPSEAEWVYACRAGTTTPYHFGETITTDLANYDGTNEHYGNDKLGINRMETTDVDYFKVANNFGLSDMHGNVWEWCLDPWHQNYNAPPTDGRVWDEENENNIYQNITANIDKLIEDMKTRVLRGGSWRRTSDVCNLSNRADYYPGSPGNDIGFRVLCEYPRLS